MIEDVGKRNLELEIRNLIKQLQAYKDKEDKLREYMLINKRDRTYADTDSVLQILNEGGNE